MVVLFLDTFNGTIQVTASTTQAIGVAIDTTDFVECFDQRRAETMPIGSYYLANGQTSVDSRALALDLRQFINVPPTWGIRQNLTYETRVREGFVATVSTLTIDETLYIDGAILLI